MKHVSVQNGLKLDFSDLFFFILIADRHCSYVQLFILLSFELNCSVFCGNYNNMWSWWLACQVCSMIFIN